MPKLSVSMIVKNEEKHLNRCLSSIRDAADEIVIVDTGSTDKTIEIAESFGAKVFNYNWINDFSSARNFALSKCSGDWILYLDADEELNSNSVNELMDKIRNNNSGGIFCAVKNLGTNITSGSIFKYPRLFINDSRLKFNGKVHEQIIESLNKNKLQIIDSNIEIIHHGYAIDEESLKEKKERNLALLLSDKKNKSNNYNKLKLIQTLISLEKFNDAEIKANLLLRDKSISKNDLSLALFYMAQIKFEKNELEAALNYALKSYRKRNEKPELNYLLYLIYLRFEKIEESLKYLLNSISMNKNLMENKIKFESENILDHTELHLRAIQLNLKLNDKSEIQRLINNLSTYVSTKKQIEISKAQSVFSNLFNNFCVSISDGEILYRLINTNHLFTLIEILKLYNNELVIISNLNTLLQIFPDSQIIYKNLAQSSMNSDTEKAIELFNKSLAITSDPSIYIHLISIYISKNDFENVKKCFNHLQVEFSNKPQIRQKIDILKEKLHPILKNSEIFQSA